MASQYLKADLIILFLPVTSTCPRLRLRLPEQAAPPFELHLLQDLLLAVIHRQHLCLLVLGRGLDLGRPRPSSYVSPHSFFLLKGKLVVIYHLILHAVTFIPFWLVATTGVFFICLISFALGLQQI